MSQRKSKTAKMMSRLCLGAWLTVLLLSPLALAHRVGIPVTTLEWHLPSQTWHLTHKLSSHDFAPVLKDIDLDRLQTTEQQVAIGRFVIENFSLTGKNSSIEISYLGAEEEGDSFYVYFLVESDDQVIEIKNYLAVIGDSDDRRHALVNIARGKDIESLMFTPEAPLKTISLTRSKAS